MASHDDLVGYPSNDTATAATNAAQAASPRLTPYRVWHCAMCHRWHAAPWIGNSHHPETPPAPVPARAGTERTLHAQHQPTR